jgi:Zn-dependent protease with chaperone function
MVFSRIAAVFLLLLALTGAAAAQDLPVEQRLGPRAAPRTDVEMSTLPVMNTVPAFDAAKATNKYLARVSGEARARSDAYFEGGYWLKLLDLVYALGVAAFLLWLPVSTRLRDWAEERTHSRTGQVVLYALVYVPLVTVLALPLTVYEGFIREHAYGLSNQSFAAWLGDFGIGFALTLGASLLLLPLLYGAIRAARESWWLWGAGLTIAFDILVAVVWPVFIAPLFNHYTPLPESPLKAQILSQARANDVPSANVWLVDASRQSNRVSANVSGFLGTARITLNDNLLKQGSPDEVLAVMGHEMGHYVMGHVTRNILMDALVILLGFAFLNFGYLWALDWFGGQWQVRKVSDVAGLPLLAALGSLYLFLMTPVTNTISRTIEYQADIFGLDAIRKPDAFATVMLKLSSYRKLEPGHWEEVIFYDHPSGRTRIEAAMRWKKEHIGDPDLRETAQVP